MSEKEEIQGQTNDFQETEQAKQAQENNWHIYIFGGSFICWVLCD